MKTIHIVGLFIFLLNSHQLPAQVKTFLTGRITDAVTGMPLPGASLRIHDINRDAIASESGEYKTTFLPDGEYLVEVSYIGYESIAEIITISGSTIKNFLLRATVVEHEGITVTGVSSATRLKQSPQPVIVLNKSELFKISSANIINSLNHIPGVHAMTTGPAVSKPFIRGLGYNRVLVIDDGIRQEGQQWGDEHGIEVDDYNVQRVEVLKGPASLMYGSDGLAGVINIQSLLPVSEGTISGNIVAEYQGNNHLRGYYGNIAGTKKGLLFNTYGSYKATQDYKNKYDGYVFNSKFNNRNFGGMFGYAGSWGHSYLRMSNYNQELGIIEGERDDATGKFLKPVAGGGMQIASIDDFKNNNPLVPYQRINHFKLSTDNSLKSGKSRISIIAGYQHNKRKEFGNPDHPVSPDVFFDLKTINYSARLNLPYKNYWRNSIGLTGMYQQNKNKALEALIPDFNLFDAGSYFFTQFHKDQFSFSGGLRIDNRKVKSKEMKEGSSVRFAGFAKNFTNISGSAGFSFEPSKNFSVKLNFARGFRAPTLAELASNGAHEGTNRFEVGSRFLKSETSFQADAGFEFNNEHISLTSGVFFNTIQNFIYYRKLVNVSGIDSMIIDPNSGDEWIVFLFDQQSAHLYGMEFNLDIHPHPWDWLHFEHTFSFTKARFKNLIDGSDNVPGIPAARYLSQLKGNFFAAGKLIRNFYLSIESDYSFRQKQVFTGYDTETATQSYWLINTSAGADIMNKGRILFSVNVSGWNITDVAYQNHLSRLKYKAVNPATGRMGVYNAGRSINFKVNIPLNFKWS